MNDQEDQKSITHKNDTYIVSESESSILVREDSKPSPPPEEISSTTSYWNCRICTRFNTNTLKCFSCGLYPNATVSDILPDIKVKPSFHSANKTGIGYDKRMTLHKEPSSSSSSSDNSLITNGIHPERPDRIVFIYDYLKATDLLSSCLEIETPKELPPSLLESCHTPSHIAHVSHTCSNEHSTLINGDTYVNGQDTHEAALISAHLVAELTARVIQNTLSNGFAIIRPPGHHAEANAAMGFCFYNNVAVAAKVALREVSRVLVVDWDVHHGNGTERIFEDTSDVMYASIHRFDSGEFYPGTGSVYDIGKGEGKGFTINIPWEEGGMGDAEYIAAFHHVLMPVFTSFSPNLVLISAGFDSAAGDPLGGCNVSPAGFAYMTSCLMNLAGGKVVVALEGGYNLESIAKSSAAVVKTLLGSEDDDRIVKPFQNVRPSALKTIASCQRILAPYWDILKLSVDIASPPPPPPPKTSCRRIQAYLTRRISSSDDVSMVSRVFSHWKNATKSCSKSPVKKKHRALGVAADHESEFNFENNMSPLSALVHSDHVHWLNSDEHTTFVTSAFDETNTIIPPPLSHEEESEEEHNNKTTDF